MFSVGKKWEHQKWVKMRIDNLILSVPCISESYAELKSEVFIFTLKPFEVPERSVKIRSS